MMTGIHGSLNGSQVQLALCAVLMHASLSAQNLTGHWTGELIQGRGSRFFIEMDLVADASGLITGRSHIVLPSHREYYAIMPLEGELRDDRLHMRETRIQEQRFGNFRWCEKSGSLAVDTNGMPWRLFGAWNSPGCVPGELVLFRSPVVVLVERSEFEPLSPAVMPERVEGRKVRWARSVDARSDSMLLMLYDDVRMDGDTVTIFLNGDCMARKIAVPHRSSPRAIPIRLAAGTNYLVMHAENVGSDPPNTAAVVLLAEGVRYELVLRSSQRRSSGLRIAYSP